MLLVLIIPLLVEITVILIKYVQYKNSTYFKVTKNSFFSVRKDTGKYGEYLTYNCLKKMEYEGSRFLFNVYIPKENGETSEIDVLMISHKGVFVFESKNYSGWIFGKENQKNWCQVLPSGKGRSKKEHFFNPIMQNRSHIKYLESVIGNNIPSYSVIVFSERCTLKDIQIESKDIHVTKRNNLNSVVNSICTQIESEILNQEEINSIYEMLFDFSQVDSDVKEQHISDINSKYKNKSAKEIMTDETNINFPAEKETALSEAVRNAEIEQLSEKNSCETEYHSDSECSDDSEHHSAICPKCGSLLVLRTAVKGTNAGKQFYGCSNFPKCRYAKNIDT